MPSPVAHTLFGLVIGRLLKPGLTVIMAGPILLGVSVVFANLPDLDYLPGLCCGEMNAYHHGCTHSITWIALVSSGLACIWKGLGLSGGRRVFFSCLLLAGSHLLADLFTEDTRPPYGIPLFWPVSEVRILSPVSVFPRFSKESLADLWQASNLVPLGREVAATLVICAILWGLARLLQGIRKRPKPAS